MKDYLIPRLNLQIDGIEPAVIEHALRLLPARMAAELRQPAGAAPAAEIAVGDAELLASRIAREVAQQVRSRAAALDAEG